MDLRSDTLFSALLNDTDRFLTSLEKFDRFTGRTNYRDGASVRSVAIRQIQKSLFKKFEDLDSGTQLLADSRAIEKFLAANSRCKSYIWPDNTSLPAYHRTLLGEFRSIFSGLFLTVTGTSVLDFDSIFKRAEVGAGANVGATGGDFYSKFASSPLSMTSPLLYRFYKTGIGYHPLEVETDKIRSAALGEMVVEGSHLSCVPKTSEISRVICTEPLLNMFFQRGVGNVMETVLTKRFSIDLSTQPVFNRRLAECSSSEDNGQDPFCTLDLASASDTIALSLIEAILDRESLKWLKLLRCQRTTLPSGESVQLHMISSMGNGYTFPLQTLIFASVVKVVYKLKGIPFERNTRNQLGNFGVFGDDIIVRRSAYNDVILLLELLGFTVNHDKSFSEGTFRESCGADFWRQSDVRGVYCKSLKTKQDLFSLINRLNVWACNHDVPLRQTVGIILKHVPKVRVPAYEQPIAGIWVPSRALFSSLRRDRKTGSVLYERYVPNPRRIPMRDVETACREPRAEQFNELSKTRASDTWPKTWIVNHPGILLSAVSGTLRRGYATPRQQHVRYSLRVAISPCWDYYDIHSRTFNAGGWDRFKANGPTVTV